VFKRAYMIFYSGREKTKSIKTIGGKGFDPDSPIAGVKGLTDPFQNSTPASLSGFSPIGTGPNLGLVLNQDPSEPCYILGSIGRWFMPPSDG